MTPNDRRLDVLRQLAAAQEAHAKRTDVLGADIEKVDRRHLRRRERGAAHPSLWASFQLTGETLPAGRARTTPGTAP